MQIEAISISQALEPNVHGEPQYLSDLLYFPEIATFSATPEKQFAAQLEVAADLLKTRPPEEIQRRQPGGEVAPAKVRITVGPPGGAATVVWSDPVTLELPYVHWRHGSGVSIAYVPCLGIEVVAATDEQLRSRIAPEVGEAILREGFSNSLLDLAYLDRGHEIEVHTRKWTLTPRTPVEEYRASQGDEADSEAVLDEVATRLDPRKMPRAYEMDPLAATLGSLLGGGKNNRRKHSVLLVGPAGVGKTALLHELVRTKKHHGLGSRPFYRTSGSRLVAGMCGFGMWQERCRKVVEEAAGKRAILHLGTLMELVEVGQSTASQESIASFLRPYLMRGQLTAVLECTPEQLAVIEKREPKLLDAFRQLTVPEPAKEAADAVLHHVFGSGFTPGAIRRAAALHRRYSSYSAFPGRPLRFLARTAAAAGGTLGTGAVLDAFSRESGMPPVLLSDDHPLDVSAASAWFSQRVAGQARAVQFVTDTLATVKTELNRPGKPLGSFFFIGPTGVGKTELAKTLAAYLFGSSDRLVRLDMSEYGTPGSAGRLVSESGLGGKEGLLTSKVREQPFSVLLLDEFEKAHPSVFDLFLQVLGEARLTDGAGRVADFTNTVVIMTSNLGAREFQRGALGFGSPGTGRGAEAHFTAAVREALRPELFNRIDRIVPFDPLPPDVMEQILRREIAAAAARDGLAGRGVALEVGDDVITHLTQIGHDPRYGARPLKRALERHVLAPAARRLATVSYRGATMQVGLGEGGEITFSLRNTGSGGAGSPAGPAARYEETAALRRDLERLARSAPLATLATTRSKLRAGLAKKNNAADRKHLAGADALSDRLEALTRSVRDEEEALLLAIAGDGAAPEPGKHREAFETLLVDLHQLVGSQVPPLCTLILLANSPGTLTLAVQTYFEAAEKLGAKPGLFTFAPGATRSGETGTPTAFELSPVPTEATGSTISAPRPEAPAFALSLEAPAANLFAAEQGTLQFSSGSGDRSRALVAFSPHPPAKIAVPEASLRKPDYSAAPVLRRFDLGRPSYHDVVLQKRGRARFGPALLATLLAQASEKQLRHEFLGD